MTQQTSSELIEDMRRLGVGRALRAIVDEEKEDGEFPNNRFNIWRKYVAEISRADIAALLGTTKRTIQSWEYGNRSPSDQALMLMGILGRFLQHNSLKIDELREGWEELLIPYQKEAA